MRFFEVRRFAVLGATFALTLLLIPAQAQYVQPPRAVETYGAPADQSRDWSDDVPAHLASVDGSVTLERDGRLEPAEANLALLAGDRLRTRGGRAEILFADGSTLALDEDTELDLLSDSLVRLLEGGLRISLTRSASAVEYRIDASAASVWIRAAGEYRVALRDTRSDEPELDLTVLRGSAELVNEFGRTLVRPGTHAVARPGLAPSLPYAVNSAAWDDFDRWTDRQRTARVGTASTRYLPTELNYYSGAFDQYGSWDYAPQHGYVWYPRVASTWRPYSQGRWSFTGHFGWFWVGIDRWSWATHHYGRWGWSNAGWYWIPDRRWGPAWVSWGSAPGYVSWCPLGYDGRPVFGWRHADPWRAWTIVPARAFVPNIWVTQHVVIHNTLPPVVRTQFVERPIASIVPRVAVARNIEPIRAPTFSRGYAAPRNARPDVNGTDSGRADTRGSTGAAPRGSTAGAPAQTRELPRSGLNVEPTAPRAVPSRTRQSPASAVVIPGVQSIEPPRADSPRAAMPDPDDQARRARPRGVPAAAPDDPPPASIGSRGGSTAPRRAEPAAPPRPAEPEPSRARSRVPNAEPARSAPPPPAEPDRARSRAPERTAPPPTAAPPAATAPPPSRGRGSDAPPPPPPTARGGGGGEPKAVPRARGGGL